MREAVRSRGIAGAGQMKFYARIAGTLLSLIAILVVGTTVYRSFDGIRHSLSSGLFLSTVFGSILAYAALLQLVGLAWHRLLTAADGPSLSTMQALVICGRTQIYKYLPSNVLHMVGRYGFAKKAGASNKALAFAQIGELLTIVSAASVLAIAFAKSTLVRALSLYGYNSQLVGALIAVVGIAALVIGIVLTARLKTAKISYRMLSALAVAFVIYVLFFLGAGLLLTALCRSFIGAVGISELIGIGTTAWLVGFVVPGAPGGLGVREALLIAGLSTAGLSVSDATAVALGYRIVTLAGDAAVAIVFMCIKLQR